MTNPTTIPVPLGSTGLVARVKFDLDMLFGNKTPTDANEAITFATGGKFTSTVNSDGTVDFGSETATVASDSDTVTVADDSQSLNVTLVATENTATGMEEGPVMYVPAGSPVTAPSA